MKEDIIYILNLNKTAPSKNFIKNKKIKIDRIRRDK